MAGIVGRPRAHGSVQRARRVHDYPVLRLAAAAVRHHRARQLHVQVLLRAWFYQPRMALAILLRNGKEMEIFFCFFVVALTYLFLVFDGRAIFNFAGWAAHPALLHALGRLNEVPGALEEQVIVVVEGIHRVHREVHLHDVCLRLEVHWERAI